MRREDEAPQKFRFFGDDLESRWKTTVNSVGYAEGLLLVDDLLNKVLPSGATTVSLLT